MTKQLTAEEVQEICDRLNTPGVASKADVRSKELCTALSRLRMHLAGRNLQGYDPFKAALHIIMLLDQHNENAAQVVQKLREGEARHKDQLTMLAEYLKQEYPEVVQAMGNDPVGVAINLLEDRKVLKRAHNQLRRELNTEKSSTASISVKINLAELKELLDRELSRISMTDRAP